MVKIYLGPAGKPIITSGTLADGIKDVKRIGLNSMEVEFVRNIFLSNSKAKEIGKLSREHGIKLSVHAPYYLNLASKKPKTIEASKQRILKSCERAHYMGAFPVVFHPGYYGNYSPKETYEIIRDSCQKITDEIKEKGLKTSIALETTGKTYQFGSLKDLLMMRDDLGTDICIDFAHLYARQAGKINYFKVLDKIRDIKRVHSHFSGIVYGASGERKHKKIGEPKFEPLAREILDSSIKEINIICESPILEKDALKMKEMFENLGYKFE